MPEYRAFIVASDGRFSSVEPLVCSDDTDAIEKARRLVNGHDVELWSGGRLVAKISHEPESR